MSGTCFQCVRIYQIGSRITMDTTEEKLSKITDDQLQSIIKRYEENGDTLPQSLKNELEKRHTKSLGPLLDKMLSDKTWTLPPKQPKWW